MTDVRHYYDANITLPLELFYIPTKGRYFSLYHYVRNINMINGSSSKCDISLNHISRGREAHLIIFCSSFFEFCF
jgi:hypothetical protein